MAWIILRFVVQQNSINPICFCYETLIWITGRCALLKTFLKEGHMDFSSDDVHVNRVEINKTCRSVFPRSFVCISTQLKSLFNDLIQFQWRSNMSKTTFR